MTGVRSRRPPAEIIQEALQKIDSLPKGRCHPALSPHAPYPTTPELLCRAAESAKRHNLRVATHVAESASEFEMFTEARGEMFNWLASSGRDMSDCGLGSPVQHLGRNGLLTPNLLAIHVNYLAPGDVKLLARHHVNIVHCPRSHAYFKHRPFPFAELSGAGLNIALGTDSLASLHKPRRELSELNLFDEMREFSAAHPGVPPKTILEMATLNGAIALGLKKQIGELSPNAAADLVTIPFTGKINDATKAVTHHRGNVTASMIAGEWVLPPA